MPRVKQGETADEEIEEWLGRLEEEELLPTDYDTFARMLKGELRMPDGSNLDYTDNQIDALWKAKGSEELYSEHGIHGLNIQYPWGTERRYGIQGLQGLFGWERVQEIGREEGWIT